MADYRIDSTDELYKVIADYQRSLTQTARLIRGIAAFALPLSDTVLDGPGSTTDCLDCECCGQQVTPSTQSGWAMRHGAVIHADCLDREMQERG